jgi:hypothetical protein
MPAVLFGADELDRGIFGGKLVVRGMEHGVRDETRDQERETEFHIPRKWRRGPAIQPAMQKTTADETGDTERFPRAPAIPGPFRV